MNHPHPGLLANYNSLTDKHLAGYFSNTRIRRHLRRSGLISRSGRIISEKEYQLNAMRKDHHKYIRECLAQAIFHKVLDMERHHQGEIKRKLETSARKDRIQRVKVERSRRAAEDGPRLLSPHPPSGPRNRLGRRRFGNRGQLGQLATYPRPSTAPGSIQQPVRLQPLLSCATDEPAPKAASRPKHLVYEKEHQYASGGEKGVLKSLDYSSGISPYRLPIVNNFMVPIPPPPRSEKKSGAPRGRRFRPTTAPNGLEQMMKETVKFYRPQIQSNAYVTMIYLGKTVHLSYDLLDNREEIKIYQQHCGGENLCVFRAKVLEGETFQFISKRHYGFPFSLTFYLNGMQVDRLSTCCEYKHRKGTRLGGKHGYFGLVNVERSAPCYRCIIAMGLDKKPSPPKKKIAVADEEKKEDSAKEEYSNKLPGSSSSGEESKYLRFTPAPKQQKEFVGDAQEMQVEARKRAIERALGDYEKSPRIAAIDAYDEDFEADEEKSDGKVNEEGQAGDQMKRMSKSPSDDEKDNLDHEKENKKSSLKASRASDSERDESDGYTGSDLEEERKQDRKVARSLSSSSMPYSSENDSDREMGKRGRKREKTDRHSGYERETAKTQREEGQGIDVEEEPDMGDATSKAARDVPHTSHKVRKARRQDSSPGSEEGKVVGSVHRSVRDDREKDVLGHSEHSRPGDTRSRGPSEDEDEGDGKSVKEKIAEAMEHDRLLSSEPEPSDSSTEDEEEESIAKKDKYKGDKHKVPDGASLAKESRALESQKVAGQVEHARQMVGKERALDEEELADEEGPEETALGEELRGKDVTARKAKRAGKKELAAELEEEAVVESDLDNAEKEVMHQEGKAAGRKAKAEKKLKKPKSSLGKGEKTQDEDEALGDDMESKEGKLLKGGVKDKTYVKIQLEDGSFVEAEDMAPGSDLEGVVSTDEEKAAISGALVYGGKGVRQGVSSEMEEIVQDISGLWGGETKKSSLEVKQKKRMSRDEGSTQQKLAPRVGEPFSESEAEGVVSAAEDEEMRDQGARVIRQAGRSAGKPISERRAGGKPHLEVREKKRISRDAGSAQEELEPWEGESLSESEAEGVISGAEDEDTTAQEARVIRKAERSGVKPSSERRAGRKTHVEVRKKIRISRDEDSAQEEPEPWEGEPLSDTEIEGVVSAAEDEDTTAQEARTIRKADRSAVKPSSERRSGRKTYQQEKKRISRDEGAAGQKLESEVDEPLLDIESEEAISGAEDEDTTAQEARVIRKAERSAVKPSSERRAGRKPHLEVREKKRISRDEGSAQEELEPWEGEPLSESEAEGVISEAEEEAQEARIIRKSERSAVKPSSERRAGRKTHVEVRKKKRISRDEGSAQEELEPWEGEPLSDTEAEGVISAAEDEDTTAQEARVIRKTERSAVKPSSERRAGRKTHVETRKKKRISRDEGSAQEEPEPWEGEPLSDTEDEGVVSAAEDEDTTAQEARVIRKAERSAVKPSSERRVGRRTHQQEKKRISRDEGAAGQKLESEVDEPLSDIESEEAISGAEDEDTTAQEARVIRKAERSAVKPSSERRAGRKPHLEVREKKRISRDEGSAQEELEPWEGEPLSESEAEGVISEAEEEAQEARIIRKAERSAVKPSSERRAGRKTHLEVREKKRISRDDSSAQEELEPLEGEPLSESEAEEVISGAEDEDTTAQEARVIRKTERSGVKPSSERRAGRKTHVEVRKKKRISRDEGSAQEELEPWEGEPLSESEAEAVVSAAEDEDTTPQEARTIQKADRSAVKPSSERRSGRKTYQQEKKRISRDEGSAGQKLESEVGEPLSESEAEGVISAAEDEHTTAQEARVIRKAERSGVKTSSERRAGRRARHEGVVASAEGAVEEEDLIEEEGEEVEEGGTEVIMGSGVAAPKQKQRVGRRKTEAEGEGEVDFEETKAGRKVAIRRRTEAEVSGKERERGSLSMAHEKEIAHGMTITGTPRVAGVTEASHLSEPFTQKAALAEGGMGSKVSFQDEVEKTPKETVAGKMSPDLEVQVEDASDEVEKEEEAYYTGEPTITLRDVEEALLAGMQKLIEQVSFMSEEVEEEEEEEPKELEGEVSVEETQMLSHKEEAGRKEVFAAVVKRKTWGAQSDKAMEAGTEEPVEEKYRNEQRRTGEEESPAENLLVKEIVPSNAQQPEGQPPVNFTLQMISLESSRTSD
ncbi:glutamate-rich protein 3 isoform X3 [Podarcis muralis]